MRVIRNLTVHDGIAGICWLVLEMYSDIKELFVAGGSKVTTDDIKGFSQFPPNLGREEIIIKEYFLKFYHRHIPHWGRVLLSLCLKFTMPTSDWALCHQHRLHFHFTLHNKGPSQSKVNSLLHLSLLAFFNFHRYCCSMDSSILRYNTLCLNPLCISL